MTALARLRLIIVLATVALIAAACGTPSASQPTTQKVQAETAATPLFIAADMVLGSKNVPADQKAARSCVLTNRFPRNSELVWRARVSDPVTGEQMDDQALKSVQVKLSNGTTVDMKFGPHPKDPPGEAYWTGSWVVPKDHPTGSLDYVIAATDANGRTGEWKPFSVKASLVTIIDETFPDAPAKP